MNDVLLWGLLLAAYFLPGLIASFRRHPSENAVALLNLLLGWTLIGWVAALIWAFTGEPRKAPTKPRLIERDSTAGRWVCPWCFGTVNPRSEFCPSCRQPVVPIA